MLHIRNLEEGVELFKVLGSDIRVNIILLLLKEKEIEYSIHALGGCTCAGLRLKQDGKEYPVNEILEVINSYLDQKWMKVRQDDKDPYILNVESKFDFEK